MGRSEAVKITTIDELKANWVPVPKLAEMLDLDPKTLRNWIYAGKDIPRSVKFGRNRYFRVSDVNEWMLRKRR